MKALREKLRRKAEADGKLKKLVLHGYTDTLWLLDRFDSWAELAEYIANRFVPGLKEKEREYGCLNYHSGQRIAAQDILRHIKAGNRASHATQLLTGRRRQ